MDSINRQSVIVEVCASLAEKAQFLNLVNIALFSKFLDGILGRVMGGDGCVNQRLQQKCCSY